MSKTATKQKQADEAKAKLGESAAEATAATKKLADEMTAEAKAKKAATKKANPANDVDPAKAGEEPKPETEEKPTPEVKRPEAKPTPTLSFVKPHANPNVNVLLYGPPKSGKTVGAASAPGPILYLNADRPNATRYAHNLRGAEMQEAPVTGLDTLVAATHLIRESDKLRDGGTVVLDPIGEVYRILLEEASGRAMRPKIQEYGDVGVHLERFCRALCEEPVNAIFVAHETVSRDEEAGTFERLPFTGTNNPAFGAKLMAMVDVIGYTGVVEDDEGGLSYMAQLINGRGRRGGDRFGVLGAARKIDLTEWVELARQATSGA